MLLKVFWDAWKTAKPFHKLVLDEIYIAINKGRPSFLSEVLCIGMIMKGDTPVLESLGLCSLEEYHIIGANPEIDCYVEGELDFKGTFVLIVKTGYKINWPSQAWYEIPLTL